MVNGNIQILYNGILIKYHKVNMTIFSQTFPNNF